jgi:hypothetical protein
MKKRRRRAARSEASRLKYPDALSSSSCKTDRQNMINDVSHVIFGIEFVPSSTIAKTHQPPGSSQRVSFPMGFHDLGSTPKVISRPAKSARKMVMC